MESASISPPKPRSNSYNLVPVLDFERARGSGACPLLHDPRAAYEGGRSLVLRLRDRMRLVRTATTDFSEAELLATRDQLGQVYADVSTKIAPDDFSRDLRKLRPSAACEGCPRGGAPRRDACPGAWEAVPGDVFSRDDARVREILSGLSGRLLDVGGGEGAYVGALLGRAGVEYTCVDPDPGRLAVLRSRHPEGRFVVGRAEDLPEDLGDFDHVILLRSYNHLTDPARALSRALSHLRPGGSLLLVDNVAFGLVRSVAHAARAERAPENQLEHYRNDGAAEAHAAVIAALPPGSTLRCAERRDVGPDTSNQWLLWYR